MFRSIIHLSLHFIVPGAVARYMFASRWKKTWLVMIAAMLVDLDHLLVNPVFDPNRCSIGFHPLHSYSAIAVYAVMAVVPKTRLAGLGLLIHMALDGIDCIWMSL